MAFMQRRITSTQRHKTALTLMSGCLDVMCLLGEHIVEANVELKIAAPYILKAYSLLE